MECTIEPMKFFFSKSCYVTHVLRIEEGVRSTCYIIVDFNVHYM